MFALESPQSGPCFNIEILIQVENIVNKRRNCSSGAISPLFHNIFKIYFYLKESNCIFICDIWLFDLSFFSVLQKLIRRRTDISKCFRGSLRLQDNKSPLYIENHVISVLYIRFIRLDQKHVGLARQASPFLSCCWSRLINLTPKDINLVFSIYFYYMKVS